MSKQTSLDKKNQENLKVLFALMTLGGKSDRAIAKFLGISNATLSRRKRKLEQDGFIKEYTIIPDLHKMGLDFIVFSFAKTSDVITSAQAKEAQDLILKQPEILTVFMEQSLGGTNWVVVSVHKNYDSYLELSDRMQKESMFRPNVETHSFMFYTGKKSPKPFTLRNLEALF